MAYTTDAEIRRYLTSRGVEAFSDHDDDGVGESDVVTDSIARADQEINSRAGQRYSQANLTASAQINRWATVMAAYYLCETGASPVPDSVSDAYDRIMKDLAHLTDCWLALDGVAEE